jgi:peptidoglycan/LPS O-acetylase OafA/YrhL
MGAIKDNIWHRWGLLALAVVVGVSSIILFLVTTDDKEFSSYKLFVTLHAVAALVFAVMVAEKEYEKATNKALFTIHLKPQK